MKREEIANKLRECFKAAERDEKRGLKHKGLAVKIPNNEEAKGYIEKAMHGVAEKRDYKRIFCIYS